MKIGHEMWLLQCLQGFSFFLPSDLVFDPAWPSFELDRGIIGTNLLTKFHEDRTRNVASRVFTRFLYSQIRKTAPPTGGHVFQRTGTTFELNQHIIKTNILTKLHEDWAWNVTSTVFTRFFFFFWPSDLVFDPAWPSFELDRGIIGTNLLTKFHEDRTRNVASRVFTRFLYSQIRKTAPPTGGHVFQRTGTTFELNQHIIKTNILTKLHEDWAWNVTSTVFTRFFFFLPSDLVFDPAWPSFELDRGIIGTNLLTPWSDDIDLYRTWPRDIYIKVFDLIVWAILWVQFKQKNFDLEGWPLPWQNLTFDLDGWPWSSNDSAVWDTYAYEIFSTYERSC